MKKNVFTLVFLIITFSIFSQEKLYKKILFDKNVQFQELRLNNDEINGTFPSFLFENTNFKKITSYFIINNESINVISKNKSSILECEFLNEVSYLKVKNKIQKFSNENYENFNPNFDYKTYNNYVQNGLIIIFDNNNKNMLMINVSSCIYAKQKQKIIEIFKNKTAYDLYILNCGGNELITKK